MKNTIPHEAHIIAFCLAKFPDFGNRLHPKLNQTQIFDIYTKLFKLPSSSFKRLRDEYDAFFPHRSGYKDALNRKSRIAIVEKYNNIPEEYLLDLSIQISKQSLSSETVAAIFQKEVNTSSHDSKERRLKRLNNANRVPDTIQTKVTVFVRNPDVVVEVQNRANGHCEYCNNPAPFIRKSDNTPYLEIHHILPLSVGGEDTIDNAVALCPNCHRKAHHG